MDAVLGSLRHEEGVGCVKYPSDLKGHEPYLYIRMSTDEQSPADKGKPLEKRKNMERQVRAIKRWLSSNKLPMPKPENIHYELASGGDPTRPVLKRAVDSAVAAKKRIQENHVRGGGVIPVHP